MCSCHIEPNAICTSSSPFPQEGVNVWVGTLVLHGLPFGHREFKRERMEDCKRAQISAMLIGMSFSCCGRILFVCNSHIEPMGTSYLWVRQVTGVHLLLLLHTYTHGVLGICHGDDVGGVSCDPRAQLAGDSS